MVGWVKRQGYWDHQLAHITEKRNRQMRDAVNKAVNLAKVCRRVLTLATRFRIWETKAKKQSGTDLSCHVATA
ncbi:hypothetical protein [Okeania sp. SIO2C9]|uniref:hypothetical protein n=1 Tax=Okeania sp. SIO2C9 TaxID=2607791 RepID=UPI0025EDAC69|nr:hypothetical protein [Okeania sp. SIO2C9]